MTDLRFTVPGPPVPWQRAGSFRGLRFTPAKTRDYQRRIAWAATAARPHDWPTDAAYSVTIGVFVGDRRARDIDNFAKTVLDAGNGILWRDDSLVTALVLTKAVDRAAPRLVVEVTADRGER